MTPHEVVLLAKVDAQVGALNLNAVNTQKQLESIGMQTKATHRLLVASSIVGPAHRFNFTLAAVALGLAVVAIVLGACR